LAYLSNVCNCDNYSERKDYICNFKFTSVGGRGQMRYAASQAWQKSISLRQMF